MNERHQKPRAARPKGARVSPPERVRIERLAAGGDGLARLSDGSVVFVPSVAPEELVEIEVDRSARPTRGRVLQLLEPSAERVAPVCAEVASCGGCDFMHLSTRAQEAAHAEIVRSAVAHAIGAEPPSIRVHKAPLALAYRTRARLFVQARGERARVRIGYRATGSHALAIVSSCAVLAPALSQALLELPSVLAGSSGEGDVQIALGDRGRLVVDISFRGELGKDAWAALDKKVADGQWAGARVCLSGVKKPATFGDPRPVLEGADGEPLVIAAGSFAQSSDLGAALLARRVAELARADVDVADSSLGSVVELFAGSGTLSVLLARHASGFVGIESEEEATRAARQNFSSRGLSGKFVVADADSFTIPNRADVVVLDPPRAGASGAMKAIVAARPSRLVYVACDPATLARDLSVLVRSGFALTHLETVELFPQTSHVETIARLVRVRGPKPSG